VGACGDDAPLVVAGDFDGFCGLFFIWFCDCEFARLGFVAMADESRLWCADRVDEARRERGRRAEAQLGRFALGAGFADGGSGAGSTGGSFRRGTVLAKYVSAPNIEGTPPAPQFVSRATCWPIDRWGLVFFDFIMLG
jgi:hypothetical protein